MIKIAIFDDEQLSLEQLEYILSKNNNVKIVATYTNPIEGLKETNKMDIDVLMLDIDMPQKSGIEIAKEILEMKKDISIVFITAYSNYAVKAFELEAIDYIVKPFSEKRVNKSMSLIEKRLKSKKVVENKVKINEYGKISVWKNNSIIILDINEVCFFTVEDKRTIAYTKNDSYIINYTLSEIEKRLNSQPFFRCYKSFIVNINHIYSVVPMFNNAYIIKLKDIDIEIPVSRHYSKKLKEILGV